MTQKILKLLYLNQDLGESGLLPRGAIVDIGGVSGTNFTIGGKGVVLADGSTTGPNGTSTQSLQTVYDNSEYGTINLTYGKDFKLVASNNRGISIDALSGNVAIDGNTFLNNVNISGLINGVINILEFYNTVNTHLEVDNLPKHESSQISVNTANFGILNSSLAEKNLQAVVENIDENLLEQANKVKTYVHTEAIGSVEWIIQHNKTSVNPIMFIYDETGNQILSDSITIIDDSNIRVQFNVSQKGKAVILFVN